MQIEAEVTVQDIDEALKYLAAGLEDKYGSRLTWRKKTLILESIDDLLDARLALTEGIE
jgi:hypothetical protein